VLGTALQIIPVDATRCISSIEYWSCETQSTLDEFQLRETVDGFPPIQLSPTTVEAPGEVETAVV
jgi:hypothetical protein